MKKCPKCGTVLDDSKVKCYMCGTDLQRQNLTNFGNSFNDNIGAVVSNNQGNVFSQNPNMPNNAGNTTDTNTFVSNSNYSNSLYNNQLNNLNSMAYDNRTALEKMFSSDNRFKSKTEINAENAMRTNQKRNNFADAFNSSVNASNMMKRQGMPNNPNNMNRPNMPNGMAPNGMAPQGMPPNGMPPNGMPPNGMAPRNAGMPMNGQVPNQPMPKKKGLNLFKKKKQKVGKGQVPMPQAAGPVPNQGAQAGKPPINWGNNLGNQQNPTAKEGFKVNPSLIFNILALTVSIIGVLLVYFKVVRTDNGDKISTFGGLKYSISNNYRLKDEKSNARVYTFGEYCSIRITYGPTNDVDSYADNLYNELKEKFGTEGLTVNRQKAKYNNNVWDEMNIVDISENAATGTGYSPLTKIQYVSIVHEGNYYTIAYQNTQDNAICSASYDSFLSTLAFK